MGGIGFDVNISGIQEYTYKLEVLQRLIPRAKDFWQYVTDDFHAIEENIWDEGQGSWEPWSKAYAAWRKGHQTTGSIKRVRGRFFSGRMSLGSDILVLTGVLKEDMTKRTLYGPTSGGVRVGTRQHYAQYHMTGAIMGGWAPGAFLPPRPFFRISASDIRRWQRMRNLWLEKQVWTAELGGSTRWDMQRRLR